jgi:hypothetical protein
VFQARLRTAGEAGERHDVMRRAVGQEAEARRRRGDTAQRILQTPGGNCTAHALVCSGVLGAKPPAAARARMWQEVLLAARR